MRVYILCFLHPGIQNTEWTCVSFSLPSENTELHQSLMKYNQWGYEVFLVKYGRGYFWWNMAEVFPGKRFLPLNIGENSASYPSSLKKHWFIRSISRNWKNAFPFLAIPVPDWKKNILATSQAGSHSDQSQKSGVLCQDHYFKPVPGALCHLCLQQRNWNPLPFLHSQGAFVPTSSTPLALLPLNSLCFSACCTFSQGEYRNSKLWGRLVSQCEKVREVRRVCPTSLQQRGRCFCLPKVNV